MNIHRESIITTLQVFASKSEQFELWWAEEQRMFIPDVLLGRWEEVYWGDDPGFQMAFSEDELQDLSCFYDFFLARANQLPKGNFKALMTDFYWDSICRFADEILGTLARNEEVES